MLLGKYYITPRGDPYLNMALDEWLFSRVRGDSELYGAILRLYSWKSEAITIGYNQSVPKVVDFSTLNDGIPIIRRITGGRAIYHDPGELTFSLVLNSKILPRHLRSLPKINELISDSVVEILSSAGVKVSRADRSDRSFAQNVRGRSQSCFGSLARNEVISGQSKVAAGAQRRVGPHLLHQGSIKLNGISACPAIGQKGVGNRGSSTFRTNRRKSFSIEEFSGIFGNVFSKNLGLNLEKSQFLAGEWEEIELSRVNLIENCLNRR